MAQFAQTLDRYDLATDGDNVREQLADTIYNIDPDDTPFQSLCKKGTSTSDLKEWLKDSYSTPDANNKHLDGNEFAGEALASPVRLQNYHQISKKEIVVSRRANKLTKAGRKSEVAYQLSKVGSALKRDMETILCGNQAAVAGSSSVAPTTASLAAWFRTNTDRDATTGADPTLSGTNDGYPNAAATDSSAVRALTEAKIHEGMAAAYAEGGKPNVLMVGTTVKSRISNYLFGSTARIATPYQDLGANRRSGATVLGAVDVFVGDYGILDILPNRFSRERDVWGLDTRYWEVSFIDKMLLETIAQTGDAQKRHLISDYALCSHSEDASFVIADVDSTTAMTA